MRTRVLLVALAGAATTASRNTASRRTGRAAGTGIAAGRLHPSLVAGDWPTACGELAPKPLWQLKTLAKQAGVAPSCATVLPKLLAEVSVSTLRAGAGVEVLSMRDGNSDAFLIYRSGNGTAIGMPLDEVPAHWLLNSVNGYPLPVGEEAGASS